MKNCPRCDKQVADDLELCECGNWFRVDRATPLEAAAPESSPANGTAGQKALNLWAGACMFFAFTTFKPNFESQGSSIDALIAAAILGSLAGAGYLLSYGFFKLLTKFKLINKFNKKTNLILGVGLAVVYFSIGFTLMIVNDSLAHQQ